MPRLIVKEIPGKGRCVFAGERIAKGEHVTCDSVIFIPRVDLDKIRLPFAAYPFVWSMTDHAIPLGPTSLVNHDGDNPNTHTFREHKDKLLGLVAKRDIEPGEEITYDYKVNLWFEPEPPARLNLKEK